MTASQSCACAIFCCAFSWAHASDFGAERARSASFKLETRSKATGQKLSSGTGFFVQNHRLALTNNHVATEAFSRPDDLELVALMPDGSEAPVRVVATEMALDLAALEIAKPAPARLELRARPAQLGEPIASAGFGAGLKFSLAQGLVAAKDDEKRFAPRLQVSAASDGGVSGGPTLDAQGRAVGVNVSAKGRAIAFSIPADAAESFLSKTERLIPSKASAPKAQTLYSIQLAQASTQTLNELIGSRRQPARVGPWRVQTPAPASTWNCRDQARTLPGGSDAPALPKPWLAQRAGFACSRDEAPMMAGAHSFGDGWSFFAYAYEPRLVGSRNAWREWAASLGPSMSGKACSIRRFDGPNGRGHVQACAEPLEGMPNLWRGSLVYTAQSPRSEGALALVLNFEGLDQASLARANAWMSTQADSASKMAAPSALGAKEKT
jgi:hypothetical protein